MSRWSAPRLHTPSFENPDLPDGYGACLDCGEVMTADQLLEPCPKATRDADAA